MHQKTEQEIMQNWKGDIDVPVVSICSASYNHENYIEEALDSFLMQETDFPFEVLMNDDCSTDNTANIIREYEKKYPNIIKPIYQKENQYSKGIKISPTFNFPRAKGKYIALCEGDDYWTDPLKLQTQVDAMKEFPEVYMSFHPVREVPANKIVTKYYDENTIIPIEEVILGGGYFCATTSLMFDIRAVKKLPPFFNNAPVGDYYLQILGSVNGGALYIDRTMATYRKYVEGSWSMSHTNDMEKTIKFFISTVKSLDDVDNFLDKKYKHVISQKKSQYLWHITYSYFRNYNYIEFKDYIEKCVNEGSEHSREIMIHYYFRKFPKFLILVLKIKRFTLDNFFSGSYRNEK